MGSRNSIQLLNNNHVFRDLFRVTVDLLPNIKREAALSLFADLSKEAAEYIRVQSQTMTTEEKLKLLGTFFFLVKGFTPLKKHQKIESAFLPQALLKRAGPYELLLPLFISLARSLDLHVHAVEISERIILKLNSKGRTLLIDFKHQCRPLSTDEALNLINEGANLTDPVPNENVLTTYLIKLKKVALKQRQLKMIYNIQSELIRLQPAVLSHLIDRARVSYALGDLQQVREDLSHYFSYAKEKYSNIKIQNLMRKIGGKNKNL